MKVAEARDAMPCLINPAINADLDTAYAVMLRVDAYFATMDRSFEWLNVSENDAYRAPPLAIEYYAAKSQRVADLLREVCKRDLIKKLSPWRVPDHVVDPIAVTTVDPIIRRRMTVGRIACDWSLIDQLFFTSDLSPWKPNRASVNLMLVGALLLAPEDERSPFARTAIELNARCRADHRAPNRALTDDHVRRALDGLAIELSAKLFEYRSLSELQAADAVTNALFWTWLGEVRLRAHTARHIWERLAPEYPRARISTIHRLRDAALSGELFVWRAESDENYDRVPEISKIGFLRVLQACRKRLASPERFARSIKTRSRRAALNV